VVTVPDEATAEVVVASARAICPYIVIVARAGTQKGVIRLGEMGAQDVIHPELEGGLEIVRHTLMRLGLSPAQVQQYTDTVRRDHYDTQVTTHEEVRLLEQFAYAMRGIEISWHEITDASPLVQTTVADVGIRNHTGASIIAVIRRNEITANPKSAFRFEAGDVFGVIGAEAQVRATQRYLQELENGQVDLAHSRLGAIGSKPFI
jgi:CPA2 family monovalent cation:H+ antiporter-2